MFLQVVYFLLSLLQIQFQYNFLPDNQQQMISPSSFRQVLRPINHGKEKKSLSMRLLLFALLLCCKFESVWKKKLSELMHHSESLYAFFSVYWYFLPSRLSFCVFLWKGWLDKQSEAQHLPLKAAYLLWFSISTVIVFLYWPLSDILHSTLPLTCFNASSFCSV